MATHVAHKRVSKTRQRLEQLAQRARAFSGGDDLSSAVALEQLGRSWHRIDDIRWPGRSFADVDHVLVGPPGIFVIDNRRWWRTLDEDLAALRKNGPTSGDVFWGLAAAAHAVGSLLGMSDRRPTPVLCVSGGDAVDTQAGQIRVVSASILVSGLSDMHAIYDDAEVSLLASRLQTCLAPATGSASDIPSQRAR